MVMILRKSDMKLVSCSKKKFIVYESAYTLPLKYSPSDLAPEIIRQAEVEVHPVSEPRVQISPEPLFDSPSLQHVQSIKSVSAHTVPVPNTTAAKMMRPPSVLDESADSQSPNQGEGLAVPEHAMYYVDLASGIRKIADATRELNIAPGIKEKILSSLSMAKKSAEGEIQAKQLSRGKRKRGNVDIDNIVEGKRAGEQLKFQIGDGVSVKAQVFDGKKPGSFSKKNPGRQFGVVKDIWLEKKVVEVEYLDGSKFKHDMKQVRLEKPKTTALLIIRVLMADFKKADDPMDKETWPKNFFEAMIRPDWRSWVEAVK